MGCARKDLDQEHASDEFRVRHYRFDGTIDYSPLQAATFQDVLDIHRAGQALLHVEETFEVVIANFIAWEETVLGLAVRQLAGRSNLTDLDYFDPARRDCHRTLFNLLSVSRAFDEQTRSMIGDLPGATDADKDAVDAFFSREFDKSLGYRVLYALRNHSQHRGLAVTGVSFGGRSLGPKAIGYAIVVRPYLHLDELRTSPKFRKATLAELERHIDPGPDPSEDSVELVPLVRAFVQGLSQVLVSLRQLAAEREASWRKAALDLCERFEPPIDDPQRFAMCAERVRDGALVEERWIGSHPWRPIDELRAKNRGLSTLGIAVIQS